LVQKDHILWKWFNQVKHPEVGRFTKTPCPEDAIGIANPLNIKLLGLTGPYTIYIKLICKALCTEVKCTFQLECTAKAKYNYDVAYMA
jgi:hypothetical protein